MINKLVQNGFIIFQGMSINCISKIINYQKEKIFLEDIFSRSELKEIKLLLDNNYHVIPNQGLVIELDLRNYPVEPLEELDIEEIYYSNQLIWFKEPTKSIPRGYYDFLSSHK